MLSAFRNAFKIPELRGKILFTVAIIAVYRLGSHLPVPGVDFDTHVGQTWRFLTMGLYHQNLDHIGLKTVLDRCRKLERQQQAGYGIRWVHEHRHALCRWQKLPEDLEVLPQV